jgi:hypothetical protein
MEYHETSGGLPLCQFRYDGQFLYVVFPVCAGRSLHQCDAPFGDRAKPVYRFTVMAGQDVTKPECVNAPAKQHFAARWQPFLDNARGPANVSQVLEAALRGVSLHRVAAFQSVSKPPSTIKKVTIRAIQFMFAGRST